MKILVLGGVAAGTKAAAKLLREDRSCEVTVLTKGKDISYAGCGLPYYVGGVIEDKAQLIVNTPEKFARLTGAKVLTRTEAEAVDTPIGFQPKAGDINLEGLDISRETVEGLLGVDKALWKEEAEGIREYYAKFGDKVPAELLRELESLENSLK